MRILTTFLNVSKPSPLLCGLCLYGSTVTVYRQSLDTFDSARCEDLVVTSSEDIIPGEAGKLVGPGSEQTNVRVWWRTGRPPFTNQFGEAAHMGGRTAASRTSGQRPWGTGQSPVEIAGRLSLLCVAIQVPGG